jgi:hypothetical protein
MVTPSKTTAGNRSPCVLRQEKKMFEAICYVVGASFICFGLPSIATFALTVWMCKRIENHGAILKRNWRN